MLPPTTRELDACGIGFVADAAGPPVRAIVAAALRGLACVKHRGAVAADARTADGSGLLVPIPPALFGEGAGVAVLFVRGDDPRPAVEAAAAAEGVTLVDWREPPLDPSALGDLARATAPRIVHAVFSGATTASDSDVERRACACAVASPPPPRAPTWRRARSAPWSTRAWPPPTPSPTSTSTSPTRRFAAPFAVFHQRFSTNTLPTWERAQPFRTLCHNGEINAAAGQRAPHAGPGRARHRGRGARAPRSCSGRCSTPHDSDSGKLDAAVELLMRAGRDLRHVMAMLVPEAWENVRDLDPEVRGFYQYHSALMEPWDGPAGIVFTDGIGVGARLDRNGLRPLRYQLCEDGLVVVCSEVGAIDVSGHGRVAARPPRPRPDAVRRPDPRLPRRRRVQAAHRRRRALRPLGRRRLLPLGAGRGRAAACPTTWSPARPCTGYTQKSSPWCSSPWPPTPTSPPSRWATTRRCPTWRRGPDRCTTTCGSASPRSPTRRSTRSANGW